MLTIIATELNLMRFLQKIKFIGCCWLWQGSPTSNGYGRFTQGSRKNLIELYVHRISYEWFIGPIPKYFVIHHTCEKRMCVNPLHLQTLPESEHGKLEMLLKGRINTNKFCKKGHEFNIITTAYYLGRKKCRICRANEERERRQLLKTNRGIL